MHITILDHIPFTLDLDALARELRLEEAADLAGLRRLAGEALGVARPKAMFGAAEVRERGEDWVEIEGIRFNGELLGRLKHTGTVLPHLATCGTELADWADTIADPLARFWADRLMERGLRAACQALDERLRQTLPAACADLNPGALPGWPLEEQRPLFTLLGETERLIGVRLTGTCLMLPAKSLSGLRFKSDEAFVNCMLCPRENCRERRAEFGEPAAG